LSISLRFSPERRRLLAALLLAGAALVGTPAGAQTVPPAAAGERARAILKDGRYQTQLPQHRSPKDLEEGEPPAARGGVNLPPISAPVIGAGAELTRIVFIVLAVAVAVLILAWLIQTLLQKMARERRGAGSEAEVEGGEAEPVRELDVEDANRLAAEGRFGEAIHALLLATIRHFAARARMEIQPSRTSRELVRLLPLTGDSRPRFNELVMAVERTLFGGEPAGAEDFQRSLERFRSLVRRAA
jgi:hypothetical protein